MGEFRAVRHLVLALAVLLAAGLLGAQDAAPPGELVARGRLLTGDGEPAANVTVLLEVSDMRIRRQVGYDSTRSDVAGEFRFNLEKYGDAPELGLQFNTRSPRYRGALRIVQAKRAEFPVAVELVLEPGSVARGVVVDTAGAPLAGAFVSCEGSDTAETDERGGFEVFGLNAYGRSRLVGFKEGYSTVTLDVTSETPTLIDGLRIELSPAARLTGVALDPFGEPITRGSLRLSLGEKSRQERLKRDGTFAFEAVPLALEGYVLTLRTDKYPDVVHPFGADSRTTESVTLRAGWPLELAGRVLWPGGIPATGSRVLVSTDPRARPLEFHTDSEGRWLATPLDPGGEWVIAAFPAEPTGRNAMGELDIARGSDDTTFSGRVDPWPNGYRSAFDIRVEGTKVTMTRTDSGRGALPGAVRYEGEIDARNSVMEGKLTVEENGATGTFRATAYRPGSTIAGEWDLREQIGEGRAIASPTMRRVRGAPFPGTQRVDIPLAPPLAVGGIVVLENGEALGDGRVYLTSWNRMGLYRRNVAITAGGAFRMEGVPDGLLELVAVDADGEMHAPPVFARAGDTTIRISPEMPEADPMDPLP